MRLVFMGTPDFSVPILQALHDHHTVVAVYTQPPRQAGRGQKPRPSPVHATADDLGLPVFTPKSLKKKDVQDEFARHDADAAVVAAYGLILPQAVLDAPRLGCINVHASLLPRWRGAAPIQRAIMAGDTESGVTIMQMDAGLDTGDMILTGQVTIDDTTTAGSLHDALSDQGASLILDALAGLESEALIAQPQPEGGVTYAEKIDKAEAVIEFDRPARDVVRHIHGLSPFPGAYIELEGTRIKILTAAVADATSSQLPGTVVDDQFHIACAEGAIRPLTVQKAGKAATDTDSFLRGFRLHPGGRVG